jgi:hypothetical protein
MSDFVFRQVDEVFDAVSEDQLAALHALDRADRERIAARRRYEEFVDAPPSPDDRTLGLTGPV